MIVDDHESAYHPCINGAKAVKARRERSAVKLYFAVALQRAYRERFADQRGRLNIHGYSCKFKGTLFCTAFRRTVCSTLHPIRKRSRAHGCQTRQLLSYSGASHTTRNV